MTRPAKVALVAAAIALVYGLYSVGSLYSWMKGPEPGSRPWQIQEFRKDLKACGQFATKREEARKLLAWKPKPPWVNPPGTESFKKEVKAWLLAQSQADLQNLGTEIPAMIARRQADELACLRDLDWPDDQIESLKKEIAEEDRKRRKRPF